MTRVALIAVMLALSGCAAQRDDGRPLSDAEPAYAMADQEGVLVCTLASRDVVLNAYATANGNRYTLCRADGTTIAANLDAAALAQLRPDLDPRRAQADDGVRVMMVDQLD